MGVIKLERRKKLRLGDILTTYGLVTDDQLNEALERQKETHEVLGEILVNMGFTTEDSILNALSEQLHLEIVQLSATTIEESVIKRFEEFATLFSENTCIPYQYNEQTRTLFIVTDNPLRIDFFSELSVKVGVTIKLKLSSKSDISNAIQKYYGDYFTKNILNIMDIDTSVSNRGGNVEVDKTDESEAPIVRLVNTIFVTAIRSGASDVHIEPLQDRVRVRYRIDGDLHEKDSYALSLLANIVSRIKVIGGMNLAEKRKPQDGRYGVRVDGTDYDIRISVLPTSYGEKIVMRFTNKERLTMDKKNLGLLPDDERKFDELLKNTNGIILVTGPTGSGKSTTLYTALSELNQENVNISTIEDPVEANIEGLNQVAINNEAGMTFPAALRCFLRQDPDIIMVGEIRDQETASLAIDAALTGHLVVSTLHTNSSIASISRLEKMGIESYLLADAMCGVLAQRLVKRLCSCKVEHKLTTIDRKKLGLSKEDHPKIFEPKGCSVCDYTGYKGRVAIYEILMFTPELKEMIADEKPTNEIEKLAIEEGLSKLRDSCKAQILNGVTSIEEMDRVTHENSIEFTKDGDEVEV